MRIEASGLNAAYGAIQALAEASVVAIPGRTLVVMGPNGAGKSTLLRILALLQRPDAGHVAVDGQPLTWPRFGDLRGRIVYAFQDPVMVHGTAQFNAELGARLRRYPDAPARATAALARMGIAELAPRSASALSGGERQRLALARCLALDPPALLLDEPFAGLDGPGRESLVRDLAPALRGRTSVVVTHFRDEAIRVGDDLAILLAGRVRQSGPVAEVLAAPNDPAVAEFLGVENLIRGRVVGEAVGTLAVEVGPCRIVAASAPRQGEVLLCLRAEDVLLAPATGAMPILSASNVLEATVRARTPIPPLIRVELDAGFPLFALATESGLATVGATVGTRVRAVFKAAAVHVLPASRG